MAGEQVPEVWVGQEVVIVLDADGESFDGPLTEVNDRGVAIRYFQNFERIAAAREQGEEEEAPDHVIYFFPWRVVRSIARREND